MGAFPPQLLFDLGRGHLEQVQHIGTGLQVELADLLLFHSKQKGISVVLGELLALILAASENGFILCESLRVAFQMRFEALNEVLMDESLVVHGNCVHY